MIRSIKDKRLRQELPRLSYNTRWTDGENAVEFVDHNFTVRVTEWYPFQCPTLEIEGLDEKEYVKRFEEQNMVNIPVLNRIVDAWCPVFGMKEMVDHYFFLKNYMDNTIQRIEPPLFSNSPTSTSTTGS